MTSLLARPESEVAGLWQPKSAPAQHDFSGEERSAKSEERSGYNRVDAPIAHRHRRSRRTGHFRGLPHHVAHVAVIRPDVRWLAQRLALAGAHLR